MFGRNDISLNFSLSGMFIQRELSVHLFNFILQVKQDLNGIYKQCHFLTGDVSAIQRPAQFSNFNP